MEFLTMYKAKETKHRSAEMVAIVISNGIAFSKLFMGEDIPRFSHKVYTEVMERPSPEIRAMLVDVSHGELERIKKGYYKA